MISTLFTVPYFGYIQAFINFIRMDPHLCYTKRQIENTLGMSLSSAEN